MTNHQTQQEWEKELDRLLYVEPPKGWTPSTQEERLQKIAYDQHKAKVSHLKSFIENLLTKERDRVAAAIEEKGWATVAGERYIKVDDLKRSLGLI